MPKGVEYELSQTLREDLHRLAIAHAILSYCGHDDLTLGHMALRDPDGRGLWIKRAELGMRELDVECFQLLSFSGELLIGEGRIHSEWPLHAELLLVRAGAGVSVHTHAEMPTILSSAGRGPRVLTTDAAYLGPVSVLNTGTSQIDTKDLATRVCEVLGSGRIVLLQNHGTVFVGQSVEQATIIGYYLVRAATVELTALSTGNDFKEATPQSATLRRQMMENEAWLRDTFECLQRRFMLTSKSPRRAAE